MIDPWLKNPTNPSAKNGKDPLAAITKVDYILITHGHFDHVGDSVEIAKKTGARLITNYELARNMAKLLGYPNEQMGFDTLMNIGGEIIIADGEVTVDMVPAIHSSGMGNPLADEKEPEVAYGGNPAGFVIKIKNGPTIYHSGDTAYFNDMALIGEQKIDVALINIGGHFRHGAGDGGTRRQGSARQGRGSAALRHVSGADAGRQGLRGKTPQAGHPRPGHAARHQN